MAYITDENRIKSGIELIAEERQRQVEVEGWNDLHDDGHKFGEIAGASACYITSYLNKKSEGRFRFERYEEAESFFVNAGDRGDRKLRRAGWRDAWPWGEEWDKRKKHDNLRSLIIAGALIAAEIDRLQAEQLKQQKA